MSRTSREGPTRTYTFSRQARLAEGRQRLMAALVERGDVALARSRALRVQCARLTELFESNHAAHLDAGH